MSTRSTYRVRERFIDDREKPKKEVTNDISLMYVQCDGYPSGHPADTAEWLAKGKAVNGIGLSEKNPLIFNGAGCLAAQLVVKYKNGAGGAYMHNLKDRGNCGEEYTYDIIVDYEDKQEPQKIIYIAYECGWKKRPKKIWEGNPKDFKKFVEKWGR
jgi:hypothetical protein